MHSFTLDVSFKIFGINLRVNQIGYWVRAFFIVMMLFIFRAPYAQVSDSLFSISVIPKKSSATLRILNVTVPTVMITYGIVSLKNETLLKLDNNIKNELQEKRHIIHTNLDNYLQFSPAVASFGMKIAGAESSHNLRDMTILYALSNILETGIVSLLKFNSYRIRPDGSGNNSFPSGHTATAFVAAEFLHQEYKDKSVWISLGGYTAATLTGVLRMSNNKHWFSDVVAGAGIGILSTKIVYWTYPSLQKTWRKKKSKNMKSFVFPYLDNGVFCLCLSHTF